MITPRAFVLLPSIQPVIDLEARISAYRELAAQDHTVLTEASGYVGIYYNDLLYSFNFVGSIVMELLVAPQTPRAIAESLAGPIERMENLAETIEAFLDDLVERGVVVVRDHGFGDR